MKKSSNKPKLRGKMGRRLRSRPLRIWISILLWRPDHGYVLYDRLLCRVRAKDSGGKLKGAIRLHRDLEWVHGPGMILTPLLGIMAYKQENAGEEVHGIASYHGTAAYVTAAAYGASIVSISWPIHWKFWK